MPPHAYLTLQGCAGIVANVVLSFEELFCLTSLAAWGTGWAVKVWTQVILGTE